MAEGGEASGNASEGGFGRRGFDLHVIAARGSEGKKLDGDLRRGFVERIAREFVALDAEEDEVGHGIIPAGGKRNRRNRFLR